VNLHRAARAPVSMSIQNDPYNHTSAGGADVRRNPVGRQTFPDPSAGPDRLINSALTLRTRDGKADLFVRRYDPIRRDNGCTLVIIHGAGEYGGRYTHFIQHIVRSGWRVIAADLRGHGRSGGTPTHLDSFEQYLEDLDLVWSQFGLTPASTAIYAHSMGGLVAVRYQQTRPQRMGALVLSAPLLALRIRVRLFKRAIGKVCHLVAPTTRFQTVVRTSDITRSAAARAGRARDPLVRRTVTAGWYYSVRRALLEALRDAERVCLPLLLLQGDEDQVVDPHWPAEWINRISSSDCTLRMLPGHYHELISEPGWDRIADEVLDWLDRRFVGTVSLSASPATLPVIETGAGENRRAA
jgi:alpha-beta hydrolase superfamily lysophospholipase